MDCTNIEKNLQRINDQLGSQCKLVAVSKYRSKEEINCLYQNGQRIFAENRVQALLERKEMLPNDVEWHLIGHLQRNKVKYLTSFISLIHSVDSISLLKEINKRGAQDNRVINCLLQVHVASEESKFGIKADKFSDFLDEISELELPFISIQGMMAMASFTDNEEQIRREFKNANELHNELLKVYPMAKERSIGMSSDYHLALENGSTMVRIGSKLFE